jgi:phage-related protein
VSLDLHVKSDIYCMGMKDAHKPLVWLHGEVKTPPLSASARIEAGVLLRKLQRGELLSLPHSRPLVAVGKQCHELRIVDQESAWRIIYRLDPDAVVILEVFNKKTRITPKSIIETCKRRLREYDAIVGERE